MFDELWSEIQDAPGEIFDMDIPELRDEKFDVNEYINANYDYWWLKLFMFVSLMRTKFQRKFLSTLV